MFSRPPPKGAGTVAVVELVFNETVPLEEIPTPTAVVETLTAAVLNGSTGNITIDVESIQLEGWYKTSHLGHVKAVRNGSLKALFMEQTL